MMRATLAKITLAASALALVAFAGGCGGGASKNSQQSNAGAQTQSSQPNAQVGASASNVDVAKLNADIERLEKAAERNPGDDDTLDELARAYVRRGDAERTSGQPQEALKDYQRALRLDPNNLEAQKNAADIQEQLGGEQQDENGAPAPAPITPNVTDDEEKPAATPSEKPTPKKP
jgi:tetratricopeptide (TPR) repeat protein